jgi:hypothetical protein
MDDHEQAKAHAVFRTVCLRIRESMRTNEGLLLDSTEVIVLNMALMEMSIEIVREAQDG